MNRIPPLHPDPLRPSPASNRAVRVGAALVGAAGILVLAGCSAPADAEGPASAPASSAPSSASGPTTAPTPPSGAAQGGTTYTDGTYTADGQYATPETVEKISVTVTLKGDVITDVKVTGDPQARETVDYQGRFVGGIASVVVGKDIDQISVSRVAGSSLTSGGFNKAIDKIKSEAKA